MQNAHAPVFIGSYAHLSTGFPRVWWRSGEGAYWQGIGARGRQCVIDTIERKQPPDTASTLPEPPVQTAHFRAAPCCEPPLAGAAGADRSKSRRPCKPVRCRAPPCCEPLWRQPLRAGACCCQVLGEPPAPRAAGAAGRKGRGFPHPAPPVQAAHCRATPCCEPLRQQPLRAGPPAARADGAAAVRRSCLLLPRALDLFAICEYASCMLC